MNYKTLISNLSGRFLENEPLKKYTHYEIGGNVDLFAFPKTVEECATLIKNCKVQEIPYFIFGKGSNLLISDDGFRGVFISLDDCAGSIEKLSNTLWNVGAGVILWDLVEETISNGVGDMSSMSWIPGTVGGALFMNAGAFGTEIEEFVESVTAITSDGEIITLSHEECEFNYRKTTQLQDKLIVSAKLNFKQVDKLEMNERSEQIIARRKFKQPLEHPSCGSVFKRPPGLYAGTLIEECGLKGFSIGGAKVSEKHSNFIVNYNNATASDVYNVIRHVQKTVLEKRNVSLEREVKLIGFPDVII